MFHVHYESMKVAVTIRSQEIRPDNSMPLTRILKDNSSVSISSISIYIAGDTCNVIILVCSILKVVEHKNLCISVTLQVCVLLYSAE